MENENSFESPEDPMKKYRNEDYVREMFEQRNQEEIEKIKQLHNLTDEQVALFCDFAVLRKQTLGKMQTEIKERKQTNPRPSGDELLMGAYIEQIEPQVREIVLNLGKKGYTTYESGFGDFDSQRISFTGEPLAQFSFPEELKKDLARAGIELIVKPNSLEFKFSQFKDLDKIKGLWRKVESAIPNLGKTAEPNNTQAAKLFRQKFGKTNI